MGVSYETSPQSNLAWFRDQIASLSRRIDDATNTARTVTARGGVVGGALALTGPVTLSGVGVLQRRGKLVSGSFRLALTGAVAQYGLLAQLPPGFRPDPAQNDVIVPGAANTGSWVPMTYYISISDGTIRPLTGSLASGNIAAFLFPPFLAG